MGIKTLKISICVNSFHPYTGGSEKVCYYLSDFLSKNGFEVSVITRRNKQRKHKDIPFNVFEYGSGDYNQFKQIITKLKPDILIIYSDVFDFFRHIIISDITSKIILCPCGANWLHTNKNFVNVFYRNINKFSNIICHSTQDRDYKLCSTDGIKNKLSVIPNGTDIEEFDGVKLTRDDLRPEYKFKKWILNVSNFFPGKGQNHIIRILNKLSKPEDYAYIQICSDIEYSIGQTLENNWKKLCSQSLNKQIKYVLEKNISRDKVIGYFKNSNVFAFTSEKEVAPLCILESMTSLLPWVSVDIGNVRDLKGGKYIPAIKDSNFNSIFDERVSNIFAKSIEDLSVNSVIAEDGRHQIESELNWTKILPQYMEVINYNA